MSFEAYVRGREQGMQDVLPLAYIGAACAEVLYRTVALQWDMSGYERDISGCHAKAAAAYRVAQAILETLEKGE